MHLGNRLKRMRKLRGLSQVKVCKGIVSPSHYSNIESGRYDASNDILELIGERLQVPTNYLIDIHEQPNAMDLLIRRFEDLVKTDLKMAKQFLEENEKEFDYIPSIHQEMEYLLIRCLYELKIRNIEKAKSVHTEVSFYIQEDNISGLSKKIKYHYYFVAGQLHFFQRNFVESFDLYNESLKYVSSEMEGAKIRFNLALICYNLNDINKGLLFAFEAKKTFMDLHKWKETIDVYILLGILYTEMKEYTDGEKVLKKALDLSRENSLDLLASKALHNLGLIYFYTKEFDKSLNYFYESLEKKKICDPSNLFLTYLCILNVNIENKQLDNIAEIIYSAQELCKNDFEKYRLKKIIAKKELQLQNYDNYVKLMEDCIVYFKEEKYWDEIITNAKELSEFFYEQRKYKKAYYFLEVELEANINMYRERHL
ncbi:helix-turn-helix transcriptional regulator [Evansella sp. AB-P1]|uniref:helix-turn-helix transcriptional regulator n=1 Tax=Evansella sp. AB-P1 TaxID=3037653 RepID=UPI00241F6D89|nr:helix-turn-helix transcriptional regulator [Evansella sp. AB-P1]MDG5786021.1 helix-turn-helix transcriptional regulator [Evansella sp. AB-P1]